METFLSSNIKLLRNRKELTQEQLAEAIGTKRASINNYENGGNNAPVEYLIALARYFNISVDSLLTVDLSSLSEKQFSELEKGYDSYTKGTKVRILATTVDSKNRDNVELVNHKVKASYLSGYNDPQFITSLPAFQLPFLSREKKYRMFQIEGDSMLPIPNKAYVTAEFFNDWNLLKDGTPCVVLTREQGIVFKVLYNKIKNNRSFIFKSLNSLYPEFEVPVNEILEIWRMVNYTTNEIPSSHVRAEELLSIVDKLKVEIKKMAN